MFILNSMKGKDNVFFSAHADSINFQDLFAMMHIFYPHKIFDAFFLLHIILGYEYQNDLRRRIEN